MCLETTKRRIWHFDYLVQRMMERTVLRGIGAELEQGGRLSRVLDIGCGNGAWKSSLSSRSDEYVGVDIRPGANVSIVANAEALPVADGSFDAVVCIMVLEHVRNYHKAVTEMHRVLKPNGILVLATHGTWTLHGEPNDFWRWTPFGLKTILSSFASCRVEQVGGSFANAIMIFNLHLRWCQESQLALRWMFSPVIALSNIIGLMCSRSASPAALPAVYVAFARK